MALVAAANSAHEADNAHEMANQMPLVPNNPGNEAKVQALQNPINGLQQQMNAIQQQLANNHQEVMQALNRAENLLPIRLSNARSYHEIKYPAGINVVDGMPTIKEDLVQLTEANCITTADALGLPLLPAHTLVAVRRRQISEYLGCGVFIRD